MALLMSVAPYAVGAATPSGTILPAQDLPWRQDTAGHPEQTARLWGDRGSGAAGVLVKVPGGWRSGARAYTSVQHVVLISGRWTHAIGGHGAAGNEVLLPGSYWLEPAGEVHEDRCEQGSECIVLVYAPDRVAAIAPVPGGQPAANTRQVGVPVVLPASELKWVSQSPDVPLRLAALWSRRDEGHFGELVRMPSGFDSGRHAHTGNYYGVLVSGTWVHVEENGAGADQELGPGSYVMQPGRGMHTDRCKQGTDCILFIYQDEKGDVIWPENR